MSGQSGAAPKWSDEQLDAIVSEGSNLLVAAAAGSGKTAVLVERIIRKIASNTDVDRLLVATFTNTAAAEMKDRIKISLERKLEEEPDSEHLRKQLALMGKASITTLHSFCMEVIRKYYSLIGLDPGFRIANETEIELIRSDVLSELFETRYEKLDEYGPFLQLVNAFGGERGDDPVFALVERLYLFSRSHPWPEQWLKETADVFRISGVDELEQSPWVAQLMADVELKLEGAIASFQQALELTRKPAGPYAYASTFESDIEVVQRLIRQLRELPWREWGACFDKLEFAKLAALRGKEHDKELQELAKDYREQGKAAVLGLAADYFGRSPEQYAQELMSLAPMMDALVSLILDFSKAFEQHKRSKGLLDFGDLEHYCLAILLDPSSTPELIVPSQAARDYQQQFEEILLDEYQDTNLVQETIVSLISKPEHGNRFMVGDVKQSIYRFRLAEPKLFLDKYKRYGREVNADPHEGKRIDLARNFRSRLQVVDAVNIVFRAIMKEKVAELTYDASAELVHGAAYFPPPESLAQCKVHAIVIDREEREIEPSAEAEDGQAEEQASQAQQLREELNAAQLEAKAIVQELQRLKSEQALVYDVREARYRPIQWRDCVILLRATSTWAPVFLEELQQVNIPAYSSIGSGYFEAVEVQTMLSVLQIIDNPYQDIPLASALRSPLFKLSAEELSHIRILSMDASFYDAVVHAAGSEDFAYEGRVKLSYFLNMLDQWRDAAREGAMADLLWRIYEETGYYDFVGGLPAGVQRQANLRALHDRARQYEATSFRGLFRFLKFIERMRENGNDLGTALAIGEGEDVVRIMTTHASKGLEFPVVFVAGLGKKFNEQDLSSSFLYHKELGFGPKYVDLQLRTSYPSLAHIAIRRAIKMELLAEEMRILYVALTRPKEKLYLIGTAPKLSKKLMKWKFSLAEDGTLTESGIASASSYMDWIGPLIAESLEQSMAASPEERQHVAWTDWVVEAIPADELSTVEAEAEALPSEECLRERQDRLRAIQALALLDGVEEDKQLHDQLAFRYPYEEATRLGSKASITEMKRIQAAFAEEEDAAFYSASAQTAADEVNMKERSDEETVSHEFTLHLQRPAFMEEKQLTPTEKGSVNHLVMQHIPLGSEIDEEVVSSTIEGMVTRKLITPFQTRAINVQAIAQLFQSELGQRMQLAAWLKRELPFAFLLSAGDVYREEAGYSADESVFVQGVIDCLFEDSEGLVLVDYKTDRIYKQNWQEQAEKHRFQLEMYARGLEMILNRKVDEIYVFFFDGGRAIRL